MDKLVIIGGSGHAKVLVDLILRMREYELVGYTEKKDYGNILGIKYLGTDEKLIDLFSSGISKAVIGIGQVGTGVNRQKIIDSITKIGYSFPAIVSDRAHINSEVKIGQGTQILDGAIINTSSKIGEYSIINTHTTIEHDSLIRSFCHIGPGATLSGGVEIGNNTFIGAGSVIIQNRKIVEHCIIGAGSVVVNDILVKGTYVGNPTRKVNE